MMLAKKVSVMNDSQIYFAVSAKTYEMVELNIEM